jgi:hypothetical protein
LKRPGSIGVIAAACILSLIAPLSWAGQPQAGLLPSSGQSITLVAQLPDTAHVAGFISPVPQASLEDGQTAEMVVLQQSWTFARGETLDAQCQVMTDPQTTAELFTAKPRYLPAAFLGSSSSLGTGQVRTFPLVSGFDPANGSMSDAQILLLLHNAPGVASSASVRITVVAF